MVNYIIFQSTLFFFIMILPTTIKSKVLIELLQLLLLYTGLHLSSSSTYIGKSSCNTKYGILCHQSPINTTSKSNSNPL
ncbi:uncharacterized protein DS421_19g672350 [Arachis hypogaea]|uniref:Uncharacterized protein n=1 Tax=Arachis hypogaea TaxID=3818 RepID=A0A6B9VDU0_ARAHY|nr:uncharacterized protein DS421_19g672350 [Arachis hypogaea]